MIRGRVGYLSGTYPRATDTFVRREVEELRRLGVEVVTISVRRPGESELVGPEQRAEAQRTHYLLPANPFRLAGAHAACLLRSPGRYLRALGLTLRGRGPGLGALARQLAYFAEAPLVVGLVRRHRVGHLHCTAAGSAGTVAMLASCLGAFGFSLAFHGEVFLEPRRWQLAEKAARARFCMCISGFTRAQAMLWSEPRDWERLEVIRCGLPSDEVAPRAPHAGRARRFLFVGRLVRLKNLPMLLEAFAPLAAADPECRLDIVGDGPERAELEGRAARLGLGGRVGFHGALARAGVQRLLSEADVFVMCSLSEGVPVVLMEAMAAGVPVIAPRLAGIPELVEEGRSGLLTTPADPAALGAAMRRLAHDPDLRNRLAAAGREVVRAEYGLEASARRLAELFERELGREARPSARRAPSGAARDPAGGGQGAGAGRSGPVAPAVAHSGDPAQ
ncbi:MAG TPA: glycosyltransferase family 4 protein [Phycisphaerales bacterium]|nr:glycosyltransferase family 4 protein [Phycisphaerales bacterium]